MINTDALFWACYLGAIAAAWFVTSGRFNGLDS